MPDSSSAVAEASFHQGKRFAAIGDTDHRDGRFYTFVAGQFRSARAAGAKHLFIEVSRDAQSYIDSYMATGNTANLAEAMGYEPVS